MSIPLWRALPDTERHTLTHRFTHLDPASLSSLESVELALLLQWLLEGQSIETVDVAEQDGAIDLKLFNPRQRQDEFARLYSGNQGLPITAMHDLLETLEGTQVKKARVYTFGTFTEAQKKLQREFPLFMELVDGNHLETRLREAQQRQRRNPAALGEWVVVESREAPPSVARRDAPTARPPVVIENRKPLKGVVRRDESFERLIRNRPWPQGFTQFTLLLAVLLFIASLSIGSAEVIALLAVNTLVAAVLWARVGYARQRRAQVFWDLLNASPDFFEIGMPYILAMRGYWVEGVRTYREGVDAERSGRHGVLVKIRKGGRASLAYCNSSLMALTSSDVDDCAKAMAQYRIKRGLLVTRVQASLGTRTTAQPLNIQIIDGEELKKWLA